MTQDLTGVECGNLHANRTGTINHLRLTVTDIVRSKAFYDPVMQRLGYRLVEESATRLAWAAWAPHGTLHWFIVSAADPKLAKIQHNRYTPGFHHLAWNVLTRKDVNDFHEYLIDLGANITDPPMEYPYEPGYYAFFFTDPDRIKLEIMHVDPSGSKEYWRTYQTDGMPKKSLEVSEPFFARTTIS